MGSYLFPPVSPCGKWTCKGCRSLGLDPTMIVSWHHFLGVNSTWNIKNVSFSGPYFQEGSWLTPRILHDSRAFEWTGAAVWAVSKMSTFPFGITVMYFILKDIESRSGYDPVEHLSFASIELWVVVVSCRDHDENPIGVQCNAADCDIMKDEGSSYKIS